ncbi:MAG: PhoH family protein [Deltaproteobacteria bacterium]|jgi:phosphate starvation-inducible PhoH-like protein|nr:PhoH family protein [Deltaproteobacteria bacterium]
MTSQDTENAKDPAADACGGHASQETAGGHAAKGAAPASRETAGGHAGKGAAPAPQETAGRRPARAGARAKAAAPAGPAAQGAVVPFARDSLGPRSQNLRILTEILGFQASQRGKEIILPAQDPALLELGRKAIAGLSVIPSRSAVPDTWETECLAHLLKNNPEVDLEDFYAGSAASSLPAAPRTMAQKRFLEAMRSHPLVFGLGPAGTGKTFLAVCAAVEALLSGDVSRIVLTRPAVEAGERLGFLPGDLADKVDPYLRPLYEALAELMPFKKIASLKSTGELEMAPLAFMRGRTLTRAFVILDEAQNATREQMKMFLTRLGPMSRAAVTGDPGQSDLPGGLPAGLLEAMEILPGTEGIMFCFFTGRDSVRHRLVRDIIEAYRSNARPQGQPPKGRGAPAPKSGL